MYHFVVPALHFYLQTGDFPGENISRLRLWQHHSNKLVHYSSDCWDIEFHVAFKRDETKWLEIIGFSDRETFDLSALERRRGHLLKAIKPFGKHPSTIIGKNTCKADAVRFVEVCHASVLTDPKFMF